MFVWIVSAMTVTKVVEGCVYIRRRYYGILPRVGGEFEHSALSPISLSLALSSNATTLNHLIRLRGSQGIQIWKQRTIDPTGPILAIPLDAFRQSKGVLLGGSACSRRSYPLRIFSWQRMETMACPIASHGIRSSGFPRQATGFHGNA